MRQACTLVIRVGMKYAFLVGKKKCIHFFVVDMKPFESCKKDKYIFTECDQKK